MKKTITKLMAALALLLFVAPPLVGWGQTRGSLTVSYGWEDNDDATNWTITEAIAKTSDQGNTGTYAGKINTNHTYVQFNQKVAVTSFSFAFKRTSNNSNYNVYIETSTDGTTWTAVETYAMSSFLNGTYTTKSHTFDGTTEYYVRFHCYNTTAVRYVDDVSITYNSGSAPTVATPSFNPEAGAYTSAQNVEISTTTEGATIHYTVDGTEPTTGSSVYSTPIAVTETTTIKAMAVKDGFDNSAVASATYTIISFEHQGTAEDPYSVADAHTAIDANIGTAGVYATGIVSAIPTAYNSTYGNITFNMVDEEGDEVFLQAYRCAGNEAANVAVGDIAVVFGDLTKYNSTYEFGQGCQLVSLEHPTVTDPYITANNVEIAYDATSGEISYTLNNPVAEGSLSVAEEVDWISNAALNTNLSKVTFDCEANPNAASRSGVVTITYTYGNNSTSKEVTVTQTGNPDVFNNISDITEVGTAHSVRGTVVATNSRGFIMGDGTGYVYYYKNATPTQTVGDMVKVSGTTGTYGQIIQFTNTAIVTEASVSNYNGTPSATVITEIPDYTQGYHLSTYLEFEGALAKDGSNYLITLGNAQIQISYPNTEQGNALTALNGKQVHVKGYFSGINSSSRFTVMLESVEEVVVAEPTITLSDSGTLNIGNYPVGGEITRTFTVEQNNLTEGITLTATNGGSLNPESIEQGAEATEVTWTFIPTEAGQFSSTITATSGQTTAQFTYMGYAKTVHNVMIDQNIVNGEVSAEPETGIEGDYITLYVTPAEGYELEALTIVDANSAPINYTDFETYYRFQMPDSDVTVNATFVEAVETHWVLSSLADLTANDVFIIVSTKGNDNYAMSNDKGASAAPTAVAVTVEDNAITSTVASNIQWTGITGDATDGYIIYSNADNTKYLYCINNNNGVRVGNGADSTFIIKDNYIYNILQGRYLGVYNNADWRCYTTIHNNIKDQTFAFYKKTIGALPPSISAEDYEITFDTDADELEYVINNPVEGGVLTAATTSDWLTVGDITGNSVEFTCTLNGDTYVARTAVVTLTYTYGEQSTTKDVTVTQTGNMAVFDLVSSITEVGGYYHVKGQVLATSSCGFVIGDSTAYVYTYMGTTSFNYAVGDEVAILGTTGSYGHVIQFTNQASIDTISNVQYNGQPYPEVITAVPDYSEGYHLSTYFEFEGVLVQPTSNYYVRLSATDSICISYPTETQQTAYDALLGNNVHVYGFFAGISSSTGFTVIVESLAESVHYAINVTPDLIELESNEAANGALEVTYQNFDASQISYAFPIFYTPDGNGGYIPFGEDEDDPIWISFTYAAQFDTIYYTVQANDTDEARTAYFQYTVDPTFNPGAYIYSNMITISQPAYAAPTSNWVLTSLANLTENDVFVIVGNNGSDFAMANNNGTGAAPAAIAVTVENDGLTGNVPDSIQWNIGITDGGYIFYPNGDTQNWLYCTNTNNGVRVGVNATNNSFVIDNGYLKNVATSRYVGIYNSSDWRCYTSINNNIKDQTFAFYRYTGPFLKVTPNLVTVNYMGSGEGDFTVTPMNVSNAFGAFVRFYDPANPENELDEEPSWIFLSYDYEETITLSYTIMETNNSYSPRTACFKYYVMCDNGGAWSNLITVIQDGKPYPTISITDDVIDVEAEGGNGTLTVDYQNFTDIVADVYFCDADGNEATYDWLTAVINNDNNFNIEYVVEENSGEARSAYFKVYAMDDESNLVYSNLVTVNQAEPQTQTVLYSYSINGNEGETIEVEAGATITLQEGTDLNEDFTFAGWTTDANDISQRMTGEYTLTEEVTVFYAVYAYTSTMGGTVTRDAASYVKVTSTDDIEDGNYLIVYEDGGIAFNGSLETLDATGNTIEVSIENGVIAANENVNASVFTIAAMDEGYSILSASGLYIGQNSNANGLATSEAAITNTITITEGEDADIVSSSAHLRYNSASNQTRFRYYKSSSYTNQQAIQLYKYTTGGTPTPQPVTNYYTRVFFTSEAVTSDIQIIGPSIVPSGSSLDMFSALGSYLILNDNPANLIIEGVVLSAQYKFNGTMLKNITACDYYENNNAGYYLIASPVDNFEPTTDNGFITDQYDLYAYDATNDLEWINYKEESNNFTSLQQNKGYLYASGVNTTLKFAGLLTGAYTKTENLNYADGENEAKRLTLIGNSSTYTLSYDVMNSQYQSVTTNFLTLNENGDGFMVSESNRFDAEPMESFFVYANEAGLKVMANSSALGGPGGSGPWNPGGPSPWGGDPWDDAPNTPSSLNITVSGNVSGHRGAVLLDNAIVSFGEGTTMKKIYLSDKSTRLYIPQANKDYAVVRSAAQGEMPVNFKANKNGTYTIAIDAKNVEMNYLHLIDNMTGDDVDLLATPSYSFEAKTTDYASRFKLVFSANDEEGSSTGSETFAFFNGSVWCISNMGKATLQVVDVLGHIVSSETVNGNAVVSTDNLTKGVYMFRLVNGENVKVQKVVVK